MAGARKTDVRLLLQKFELKIKISGIKRNILFDELPKDFQIPDGEISGKTGGMV